MVSRLIIEADPEQSKDCWQQGVPAVTSETVHQRGSLSRGPNARESEASSPFGARAGAETLAACVTPHTKGAQCFFQGA